MFVFFLFLSIIDEKEKLRLLGEKESREDDEKIRKTSIAVDAR